MNSILKNILTQYNKKKTEAEYEAELRKEELYKSYPQLQEIDDKLSTLAISTTKSLINNNDKSLLIKLNKDIEDLKNKKKKILQSLKISEEYFLPQYECKICKDSGYITNPDYSTSMCSCLKQKL